MPSSPVNEAALLARMERQAQAINGPGLSTTIRGPELRGLLDIINRHTAEVAQAAKAAERASRRAAARPASSSTKGRGKAAPASSGPDPEVVSGLLRAADEILSSKAELWGQKLPEAIEAWGEQGGDPVPTEWQDLIAAALA